MARSVIATDNFNRAGPGLGADWAQLNAGDGSVIIVGSTHIEQNFDGVARWVGAGTFTDDQYSSLKLTTVPDGGQGGLFGVVARASADTGAARDFYLVEVSDDDVLTIKKVINGTQTTLESLAAQEFAAGTRIEIEVEGTTIRALKDGTVLLTATGQTELTTGKPGVRAMTDTSPNWEGDDWEGGNLTAAAAVIPRTLMAPIGSAA